MVGYTGAAVGEAGAAADHRALADAARLALRPRRVLGGAGVRALRLRRRRAGLPGLRVRILGQRLVAPGSPHQ